MMGIPIIIICYNNYKYVDNMINQLVKLNKSLQKNIIIMDNNSTSEETINYLKTTSYRVRFNNSNQGPNINKKFNSEFYYSLPDMFIITDPDLELNPKLPSNFIDTLVEISEKYKVEKVGLALDIRDGEDMLDEDILYVLWERYLNKDFLYTKKYGIVEWEKRFWEDRLENKDYELYRAETETTFCLVNKKGFDQIRIAGNFTAKHLPWYKENKLFNIYENYNLNKDFKPISTTAKVLLEYINRHYLKVNKNDIYFFINNKINESNLDFWRNNYPSWENDTFQVFDNFLDKNKIFIDIGAWIGTTCIYASRKSKHIFAIEADRKSIESLEQNCKDNCRNYTIINRAIFNKDNQDIKFGKNLYRDDAKLNDSTSQIYLNDETSDDYYSIKTITLKTIIQENNIDISNISLIKVDIEGGEEHILNDLYEIHSLYKIPLYISFHYSWWKNNDLDRFTFLTEEQKNNIRYNPFISLVFSQT
jgi:FkbM family methyltransferase